MRRRRAAPWRTWSRSDFSIPLPTPPRTERTVRAGICSYFVLDNRPKLRYIVLHPPRRGRARGVGCGGGCGFRPDRVSQARRRRDPERETTQAAAFGRGLLRPLPSLARTGCATHPGLREMRLKGHGDDCGIPDHAPEREAGLLQESRVRDDLGPPHERQPAPELPRPLRRSGEAQTSRASPSRSRTEPGPVRPSFPPHAAGSRCPLPFSSVPFLH
ncbi:hypothetical protein DES45_109104 [Microvirga subterranea]|uniref:Uncharacterized protein n=1 Tax=Microvirga subterranea TaxID=186651 RepID=A0A370HG80_9HYPH|nr:hypothetical protein DES45_109104 [Microvirga subterranea]